MTIFPDLFVCSPLQLICAEVVVIYGQHHQSSLTAFLEFLQDSWSWWCARDLPRFSKLSRVAVMEKTTTCSQPRDVRETQLSPLSAPGSLSASIPFQPCLSCQQHCLLARASLKQLQQSQHATCEIPLVRIKLGCEDFYGYRIKRQDAIFCIKWESPEMLMKVH